MRRWKLIAVSGAVAALGWSAAGSAAPIITGVSASGAGCTTFATCAGSFTNTINDTTRSIDLAKTFNTVNPITLTFTVGHSTGADTGPATPYTVTEAITNQTGVPFTDYHMAINEPAPPNGVVFSNFQSSTLGGFTLSGAPASGPRNLNFTGSLGNSGTANAAFSLSPFDPGAGSTYQFSITQTATIPEPGTWGMLAAGLIAVVGVMRRRMNA